MDRGDVRPPSERGDDDENQPGEFHGADHSGCPAGTNLAFAHLPQEHPPANGYEWRCRLKREDRMSLVSDGGEEAERLAAQYATAESLRARIETHARYSVGPSLEAAVDAALALCGGEDLLDVGTGTGGFPARLRREGHRGRLVGVDASAGMVRD